MKKTSKKLTVVLMALVMVCSVFALAACGSKDVAVTGVTLNKTEVELFLDGTAAEKTVDLVATVEPTGATNKEVTWESDDTSVATVSTSGKVTAVGKGVAIITATTTDGEKTATCGVTVSQHVNLLASIEQEADEFTVLGSDPAVPIEIDRNATMEFYSDDSDATTGKVIIKNTKIVQDLRLLAIARPDYADFIFISAAVDEIETTFYYQDGKLYIEKVTITAELPSTETEENGGGVIKDGEGNPVLTEQEVEISFILTGEVEDEEITVESTAGNFVLTLVDITSTKIIEKPSELGELLVTLTSTAGTMTNANVTNDPIAATGTMKFYNSGKIVLSNLLAQLAMDDFTVTYTFAGDVLTIADGATGAPFMGQSFPQTVKFVVTDGAEGAKVISARFLNGGSETDVRTIDFTISAADLAKLA